MIKRIWVLLSFTVLMCAHQDSEYITEIKKHQEDLNQQFLDPQRSPLSQEDRERFEGHDFFPIDQSFAVNANVERTPESRPFQMAMSSGAPQLYKRIGILIFELKGEKIALEAYTRFQAFGLSMKTTPVLIPIIDQTTGNTTYEAGRYIILKDIPEGDKWLIDFNKLTNPYCAYNDKIACPRVPDANHLELAIEAGIKGF